MQPTLTHPHAVAAVQLAEIDRPKRDHVNLVLHETRTPRSLYTLARLLRAVQMVDEMEQIDRINAAYPAIDAKAA